MNKGDLICLYGASGSGKTRLLQAMEEALSSMEVLRTGAEAIIWEMTDSLRYAEMTEFRRKYLRVENLLVDNFWVLKNKLVTASEICGLVREWQQSGKLTVVASDIYEQEWKIRNGRVADLLAGGRSVHLGGNEDYDQVENG